MEAAGAPVDVAESNGRLEESFGPALAALKTFLARELDGDFEWGAGLPLPGFHVFEATALRPGEPTGDAHFDMQYVWGRFEQPILASCRSPSPFRSRRRHVARARACRLRGIRAAVRR